MMLSDKQATYAPNNKTVLQENKYMQPFTENHLLSNVSLTPHLPNASENNILRDTGAAHGPSEGRGSLNPNFLGGADAAMLQS